MWKVWITDMDIYMGWEIKVPALVSLNFHWHIMENQTPLSVHQAIKDKCVCYCSHSVFLSVLCAPLGDVKACCRTAINPKLLVFFFFFLFSLSQREPVVWQKIDHGSGLDRDLYDKSHWGLNVQQCLMNDLSAFLITKHSHQVGHQHRQVW